MAKPRKLFRLIRTALRLAAIGGMVAAWRKRQADQNDVMASSPTPPTPPAPSSPPT